MNRKIAFDPGALNHRFVLESLTETPNGLGEMNQSWQVVADVWGTLGPAKPTSNQLAQQRQEMLTHEIVLRFRPDIMSGWRLREGVRTFEIITVHDPDECSQYLVCMTREEGR